MHAAQWFPIDLSEGEDQLSPVELAFVATLRERASTWPTDEIGSVASRPDGSDVLLAALLLALRSYSAHFNGTSVRGDAPDGDPYFPLPSPPSRWAMTTATGQPDDLARHTADWFEDLIRRYGRRNDLT